MMPGIRTDMQLDTLFRGLVANVPSREIVDLTLDSRQAVRDGLFLACRGTRQHGLDFLDDALRAGIGAVAWEPGDGASLPALPSTVTGLAVPDLRRQLGALANRFFADPSRELAVAAITGTNGKTTTAWLVMQAIDALGGRGGYLGTLGAGRFGAVSAADLTTPDCISFHRRLRALRNEGVTHVAAEVSSHALDQNRIDGARLAVAALTNLSRDHLDYHGTLEAYGAAKARLFALGAESAVLNLDDPFGRVLATRLPGGTRLIGISRSGESRASLHAETITQRGDGLVLRLTGEFGTAELVSGLWGEFNAENLLLAAGILVALGWPLSRVVEALGAAAAPAGRMQRIAGSAGQPAVLIDFAHTPDALRQALLAIRAHGARQIWCVFGCGGERDRGKRAPMGAAASAHADHVVVTDDNPRGEDPQQIIADVLAGADTLERWQVVPDRRQAIERAIHSAGPGDVVLIAGKGHEAVQIVGSVRQAFSDAAVAEAALATVHSA
jgi:UDP-N-acetylmuramoyl-L-alanyl-D-glutamate--2,6-diaminopimelate ligase